MATLESFDPDYPNRAEEVKEFDDTKAGVKGLVDTGLVKIPKFFIHLPENRPETPAGDNSIKHQQALPVINLDGLAGGERRREIVEEIGRASEEWGFFQIVNHGIPSKVMEEIVEGVRRFNEEDMEGKAKIYSRDGTKKVRFSTNFDLFRSRAADWRDTLTCSFDLGIDPQDLPSVCRDIMMEYSKTVTKLAETLCELLSEALGLQPTFLQKDMNCVKLQDMVSHYYPPCPEPQLTLGSTKHSDPALLTILLQDHNGGLQFIRRQQWVDITPIPGALVINIGDILQILSNGRFKSMGHRVLSSHLGPRISVAAFFNPNRWGQTPYGPIKELISESNPQVYRETTIKDYITYFRSHALSVGAALNSLKL